MSVVFSHITSSSVLQRVYCSGHDGGHDGNDFFMTENNNGDEYENNDASNLTSTEALRAAMGEGGAGNLLVLDSLGVHRRLDKINKSFVAEQLSVYPDVLKVIMRNCPQFFKVLTTCVDSRLSTSKMGKCFTLRQP